VSRISFQTGKQKYFIDGLLQTKRISNKKLAKICNVSDRTIRDWRREKFKLPDKALLQIRKKLNVKIPSDIEYLSDYWYVAKGASKGGLKRLAIYGPPGTLEGRKKGGRISQERRKLHPELYPNCIIRKKFKFPEKSINLAECVGIILGDGNITDYQLKVYLDRVVDYEYADYVRQLFNTVFGEYPHVSENTRDNTLVLVISGASLIDRLHEVGLHKGNKIKKQVDFPPWIWERNEYQISCVKGLIDTDGGLYFHKHWTNGIKYRNLGLCFTSWSKPLIKSVGEVLKINEIKYSVDNFQRIYVYSFNAIETYARIFGSSNTKFHNKLQDYKTHSRILDKIGGVA